MYKYILLLLLFASCSATKQFNKDLKQAERFLHENPSYGARFCDAEYPLVLNPAQIDTVITYDTVQPSNDGVLETMNTAPRYTVRTASGTPPRTVTRNEPVLLGKEPAFISYNVPAPPVISKTITITKTVPVENTKRIKALEAQNAACADAGLTLSRQADVKDAKIKELKGFKKTVVWLGIVLAMGGIAFGYFRGKAAGLKAIKNAVV